MAKTNPHLKYSMLALSARQLERKDRSISASMSLSLYQEAIHCLLPKLHTRDIAVIASCVVLCVLEMLSCMRLVCMVAIANRDQARPRLGVGILMDVLA